ncbi:MAG TPA: GNAT family N-acetyltransferase [Fimbriimonadaceae bacterium]|nr:GNAT family N-acetyltransferase [Fimbriimonadaceae bacterium]
MADVRIRLAAPEEAPILARHRCEMFREMGRLRPECFDGLAKASEQAFREMMPDGRYIGWLAVNDDAVVGGGGMQIREILPRPRIDGVLLGPGPQGVILNMFVEPHCRRQGIARALMIAMIEYAGRSRIASLVLHPSEAGRGLYEELGFVPTGEMRLYVR